jgi:hypothetical protein
LRQRLASFDPVSWPNVGKNLSSFQFYRRNPKKITKKFGGSLAAMMEINALKSVLFDGASLIRR